MEDKINKLQSDMAVVKNDISHIRGLVVEIKDCTKEDAKKYVTVNRFRPVEMMAFGFAGLFLTAVVLALLSQVVHAYNLLT